MPLVLQNRLLGGWVPGPRILVAFGCGNFCLPASGAIAVQHFFHSNGSISIIDSSAGKNGGALLLSSSGVGTTWLWPAEDQRGPKRDHLVLMFQAEFCLPIGLFVTWPLFYVLCVP